LRYSEGRRLVVVRKRGHNSVVQLVGFHPLSLLDDITEAARVQIYNTVNTIEDWASRQVDDNDEDAVREVEIVCLALSVLMLSAGDVS
jgi:hypothetical protein